MRGGDFGPPIPPSDFSFENDEVREGWTVIGDGFDD
jgi:hypothetical protein